MSIGSVERTVINGIIGIKSIKEVELKELVRNVQTVVSQEEGEYSADDDFATVIENITSALEEYDFALRRVRDQETGDYVYLFVNKVNNEITQKATLYKPEEIDVLKGIINAIFSESVNTNPFDRYWITFEASKKLQELEEIRKKFESSTFDQIIQRLIEDGWLEMKEKGSTFGKNRIYLSSRSLNELYPYLYELYGPNGLGTFYTCGGCGNRFTIGRQCKSSNSCTRLHEFCAQAYFQKYSNGEERCATCGEDMSDYWPVNVDN